MKPVIVILGAGISGLSLAWQLRKEYGDQIDLKVIEKSSRSGGWIQTIQQNDFLFEQGPRSCRTNRAGTATLNLVEELNLQDQVIEADKSAHIRYLFRHGSLHQIPNSFKSFGASSFKGMLIKSILKDLTSARRQIPDESIGSFITRRFGRKLAEEFVDPFVSGVFAGDMDKLSVAACFPHFVKAEEQHRSLIWGSLKRKSKPITSSPFVQKMQKSSLFTFKGGMETLTKALADRLENHITYQKYAIGLKAHEEGINIQLDDGEILACNHLFCTIPSHELVSLFNNESVKACLNNIPFASVAAVNLGYNKNVLKSEGFGYLVPSNEKEKILGVVWDSSAFSKQNTHPNQTRLTVMIGGSRFESFEQHNAESFKTIAIEAVSRQMNINSEPDAIQIKIAKHAIPQYLIGHQANLTHLRQLTAQFSPHITLLGNSFQDISVNECISASVSTSRTFKIIHS